MICHLFFQTRYRDLVRPQVPRVLLHPRAVGALRRHGRHLRAAGAQGEAAVQVIRLVHARGNISLGNRFFEPCFTYTRTVIVSFRQITIVLINF